MESIRGFVKSYIYQNKDNGYAIARFEDENGNSFTIVGYFPTLNEEVEYEFIGTFVEHKTYGTQFKVETFKKLDVQSRTGLIQYLSSPFFTGIGPATANKIVDALGLDAIKKILDDQRVLKTLGFNPIKSQRLYDELYAHQQTEHILVALYGYGISAKVAMRLLNIYGHKTIEILEEDPFRLMYEVDGFGFIRAYEIAKKMNIPPADMRCLKAATIYALNRVAVSRGDLYMFEEGLVYQVNQMLSIEVDLKVALEALISEEKMTAEDSKYFLTSSYQAEINVAKKLLLLNSQALDVIPSQVDEIISSIEQEKEITYTKTQKEAILTALANPLTIITGGPGTGKTTIIDGLLKLYAHAHDIRLKDEYVTSKIGLMAPTGRAAKRMEELLKIKARTIHSQLGYDFEGKYLYNQNYPLPQKILIIDEASMIDIFLAKRLLDAIALGTKVVIVGDEDQLPSVGPGYFLGDMIASLKIPTVRLKDIHRQAKDSQIISLAQAVNSQQLEYTNLTTSDDIVVINGDIPMIRRAILEGIEGLIKKGYDLHNDIQVLIPMYKGDLGIDMMNQLIQKRFNPYAEASEKMTYEQKEFFVGDKVIQLVNDKERHIMNGDIGRISYIGKNNEQKQYMRVVFEENEVMFLQADLESLNLAYAVSIHKSQGSEYPIVFLPVIRPYMHMLKKELIYTAITRAKKYLFVMGDMSLLKYASNQLVEKRLTMLSMRLHALPVSKHDSNDDTDFSPYDFM